MSWKTSQNRKVYQRMVNKAMRAVNENIERDSLWRGRFVVRQVRADWVDDCFGGRALVVELEFRDKKTGYTSTMVREANSLCFLNGHKVFEQMNYFITEECNVWVKEGFEVLYADKTDYTKVR